MLFKGLVSFHNFPNFHVPYIAGAIGFIQGPPFYINYVTLGDVFLVLAYFIETEDNLHQATPFNLLPVRLARREFALDLAAVLPSSSIDLSFGWTRPRHLLGFTPLINFYSESDIDTLLKDTQIKNQHKFFLAWKNFSVELIEHSSTKTGPSLVLTTNNCI